MSASRVLDALSPLWRKRVTDLRARADEFVRDLQPGQVLYDDEADGGKRGEWRGWAMFSHLLPGVLHKHGLRRERIEGGWRILALETDSTTTQIQCRRCGAAWFRCPCLAVLPLAPETDATMEATARAVNGCFGGRT